MNRRLAVLLSFWLLFSPFPVSALEYEFSGHLRGQSSLSWYQENHLLSVAEDQQLFLDGSSDLRLNSAFFLTDHISLELAYEAAGVGGQSRKAIAKLVPDSSYAQLFRVSAPSDDQQLFDLTGVLSTDEEYIAYHRIQQKILLICVQVI